jgi:hypothetical protein
MRACAVRDIAVDGQTFELCARQEIRVTNLPTHVAGEPHPQLHFDL